MLSRVQQPIFLATMGEDGTWRVGPKKEGTKTLTDAIAGMLPSLPPSSPHTTVVYIQDGVRQMRVRVVVDDTGWETSVRFSCQDDPFSSSVPGPRMATDLVARLVSAGFYATN